MTYALDTNAIIDILNKEAAIVKRFNDAVKGDTLLIIPSVVDYEVSRGFTIPQTRAKKPYTKICAQIALLWM